MSKHPSTATTAVPTFSTKDKNASSSSSSSSFSSANLQARKFTELKLKLNASRKENARASKEEQLAATNPQAAKQLRSITRLVEPRQPTSSGNKTNDSKNQNGKRAHPSSREDKEDDAEEITDVQDLLHDTVDDASVRAARFGRKRQKRLYHAGDDLIKDKTANRDDEDDADDDDFVDPIMGNPLNVKPSKYMYNPYSNEAQNEVYEKKINGLSNIPSTNLRIQSNSPEISQQYTSRLPITADAVQRVIEESVLRKQQAKQFSRRRRHDADEDVTYINERNRRFNRKLGRDYDTHMKEVQQSIERGTAL